MLTEDQASKVADEFIAQQRALSAEQRRASAPSVSFIYRGPEMARLSREEQAVLLRRAKAIVFRQWSIHVTVLVLFATVLLAWLVSHGAPKISGALISVVGLAAVATNVLRALIVRLVVRILAGHPASTGSGGDGTTA